MNKKSILLLVLSLAFIAGFLYWIFAIRQTQNQVTVTVDSSLSSDKVQIELGFYSINSGSDQNLVATGLDQVVFNGNSTGDFETICGENDFLIIYNQKYYAILRHFIPSDFYDGIPKPHHYHFDLKEHQGEMFLKLNILGRDGTFLETELVSISDASEYIWGRPIMNTK